MKKGNLTVDDEISCERKEEGQIRRRSEQGKKRKGCLRREAAFEHRPRRDREGRKWSRYLRGAQGGWKEEGRLHGAGEKTSRGSTRGEKRKKKKGEALHAPSCKENLLLL